MKLISLNIWGGKLFEPLVEFVKRSAETTDIFCFQEVFQTTGEFAARGEGEPHSIAKGCRADMFAALERTLPDFRGYFAKTVEGWDFDGQVSFPLAFGEASFVRNTFAVGAHRKISIYETASGGPEDGFERPRSMQYLEMSDGKNMPIHPVRNREGSQRASVSNGVHIFNLHGLLDSGHKRDTEKRLAQFELVRKYVDEAGSRTLLCGDFNAYPDTKSIGMFEGEMRNLLKEYGMPRTRNPNYADMEKYGDYWGDHIFVTPDVEVKKFAVLDDVVSDHLPLMIEFL